MKGLQNMNFNCPLGLIHVHFNIVLHELQEMQLEVSNITETVVIDL